MKTVILAGGFARRLGGMGKNTPKALLVVGGLPILSHILLRLEETAIPGDVYVAVNACHEDAFRRWLSDFPLARKPTLVVEATTRESEKLGAVGGLLHCVERFSAQEDILVINGDNIFAFDFGPFVRLGQTEHAPVIGVYSLDSLEQASHMGVVTLTSHTSRVVATLREKPRRPESTLVSTGMYYFTSQVVRLLGEYVGKARLRDNMGDFISWLLGRQRVLAFNFTGRWFHITTASDYMLAKKAFWHTEAPPDICREVEPYQGPRPRRENDQQRAVTAISSLRR